MSEPVSRDATTPVDAGWSDDDAGWTRPSSDGPRVLTARYLLEERVASGGMASVWRAHDEVLARTVAVKLLHDHLAADEDFRERFRREAIAAAKLTHPNVVSLYDTGSDGACVYLVMEFIEGVTLRDVIREEGRLAIDQAAAIGEQVARALDYAHSRGLVHRDVKPANILIGTDGAVKVADFGIAKADQSDDLTRTGMVLGTAAYVAPEQIRGEPVTGKADQYGLAIVLYEALTGRQPFKADSPVATAAQRLERDPLPVRSLRANVPRGLDGVLMRALARDPRDRFPSAGAFADALAAFAGGGSAEDTAALATQGLAAAGPPGASRIVPGPAPAAAPPVEPAESFLHSEGRFLAPVLALVLLASALVAVGLWTGVLDAEGGFPRIASQEDAREDGDEAEGSALVPFASTPTVFDPFGSGVEHDEDLVNLVDGDPATSWRTQQYNSPAFGNLKPGVGFYVDLGEPHDIETVALRTITPGITVEVRTADEPAADLDGWQLVGSVAQAPGELIEISPDDDVTARYVLVWVTGELPPFEGRYAGGFSQVAVTGAPA